MAELVEHFSQFRELEKPITYLRNGLGDRYTCLLYPGMEPTNILSEQVIREHVLMRKIIGTFRSEKGAEYYPTSLPSSQHGDCKEWTSTTSCKRYSRTSSVYSELNKYPKHYKRNMERSFDPSVAQLEDVTVDAAKKALESA